MLDQYIDISSLSLEQIQQLAGVNDKNFSLVEKAFDVTVILKNNQLLIKGKRIEQLNSAYSTLTSMINDLLKTGEVNSQVTKYEILSVNDHYEISYDQLASTVIGRSIGGKVIHPKTLGQYYFNENMDQKAITFALGPAGTGKTYLAVVKAVTALKKGEVNKIVLTRPAVEAGESLGFLPGDLKEKVDPYLTPLYDCLNEMLGFEQVEKYIEKQVIEIAPLAYMRGRTLNKAFVILDEAQNTTINQMKMFLTRLGFNSKMVITGDPSQVDLDKRVTSGLQDAVNKCIDIEEVGVVYLKSSDVVRNPIVSKIIDAYDQGEKYAKH